MTETNSHWQAKLLIKPIYLLVGFLVVNLYSNQTYNLTNFLKDHPSFPMGFIPDFVIPYIYPIIFSLPAIIYGELKLANNAAFKGYDRRILVVLGQFVFSICFLSFLWFLMVNTPGYSSQIDKSQINEAFQGYCISVFIVMGLLGSDEVKDLIKEKIGIDKG